MGFVLPEPLSSWCLMVGDVAIQAGVEMLRFIPGKVCYPAVGSVGALTLFIVLILRRREWLMTAIVLLVICSRPFPVEHLEILFLNVGQGDASLVSWPDGRHWLIDGGPNRNSVVRYLRRERISQLDVVVLSHFHADHGNGILGVHGIPIREIWIPHWPEPENEEWRQWLITKSMQGTIILLPNQINHKNVRVLHPLDDSGSMRATTNNKSLVLELNHAGQRVLWTGDIDLEVETAICEKLRPVDILKVAHHGSRNSTSEGFLSKTTPKYAVISNGRGNKFGHPHSETIWRLRKSTVLRTDQHHSIKARFNDNTIMFSGLSPESRSELAVTDH
jgi:competence protein ComEC